MLTLIFAAISGCRVKTVLEIDVVRHWVLLEANPPCQRATWVGSCTHATATFPAMWVQVGCNWRFDFLKAPIEDWGSGFLHVRGVGFESLRVRGLYSNSYGSTFLQPQLHRPDDLLTLRHLRLCRHPANLNALQLNHLSSLAVPYWLGQGSQIQS